MTSLDLIAPSALFLIIGLRGPLTLRRSVGDTLAEAATLAIVDEFKFRLEFSIALIKSFFYCDVVYLTLKVTRPISI